MSTVDDQQMSGFVGLWQRLGSLGRWSLSAGIVLCAALAGLVLWWAMHTDYQVLFANLEESDASAVVTALKAQKIPYRLDDTRGTISVPAGQVYATRLALMSGNVPLTGGVGFEIFDRQGLGATEQSQRVAYQRALQGELARTIGALEPVRQARVLLVLPESTLFKRDQQKPRAAVSLILRNNARLLDEQVTGVQRLVAASVAGMDVNQVVVTDQRGVTLSAPDAGLLDSAAAGTRLKLKTQFEDYFAGKIYTMLEKVVGPGKAIVTVDAALNFDQITRTLQTLVPLDGSDASKGGGLLRRHEAHSRANTTPDNVDTARGNDVTSSDFEYEFGKRIEQVAAAPGALAHLSVSLIVPGTMTAERETRLQQLIRAAVGIDTTRGDTVVVESLERVAGGSISNDVPAESVNASAWQSDDSIAPVDRSPADGVARTGIAVPKFLSPLVALAIGAFLLLMVVAIIVRQSRSGVRLSKQGREALLADIVATLESPRNETARRI